jgi:hypothetical protein
LRTVTTMTVVNSAMRVVPEAWTRPFMGKGSQES